MQFLRTTSKSKIVLLLTTVIGVSMVVLGLEKGILTDIRTEPKTIDQKINFKFRNLVQAHIQSHNDEPTSEELVNYQNRALQITQMEEKLRKFFKQEKFKISTKELLNLIENSDNLHPLLKKIESSSPADKKELPLYLSEIKLLAEQNIFQHLITSTAMIPKENKEQIRNIHMQEREFEWLKVDGQYLNNAEFEIENDAEVHEIYQNGSFLTEPLAKINYITLESAKISPPVTSDDEIKRLIKSEKIPTTTYNVFKTTEYQLSNRQTNKHLNFDDIEAKTVNSEKLQENRINKKIYYTKKSDTTLNESQAISSKVNQLSTGQYLYNAEKNTLILLNQTNEKKCFSKKCLSLAKNKYIEQERKRKIHELTNKVQEAKLFDPKDLKKVANEVNVSIKESTFISPHSKSPLISENLKEHIFKNHNRSSISEPVKLENGDIVFYQMQSYKPEQKKPLNDVRPEIVKHIRKTHQDKQLAQDLNLSIKRLHNGEEIDTIAKKFKVKKEYAATFKQLRDKIPTNVLHAASQIPSTDIGWAKPILEYSSDEKSYYIVTLKNVTYTNKNNTSSKNVISDESIEQIIHSQEMNALYQEIFSD